MKKEIFRCLGIIKKDSKNFLLLSNAKTFKYILEVNDKNELQYPQFEDFIYFNNLFNTRKEISYIFSKSNGEKLEKGKKINIIPKVIHKGALLSVISAVILSGCDINDSLKIEIGDDISTVEESNTEAQEAWEEENRETIEYLSTCTDEEFLNFLNWETETINENLILVRHSGEKNRFDKNKIVSKEVDYYYSNKDVDENYFKEKITLDTVYETINQNINISDTYKNYLIDGLNKITINGNDLSVIDLETLNYNLKKMNVIELSKNEIKETAGDGAYAFFEHTTGNVYVPDMIGNDSLEKQQQVINHEILGHASSNAEFDENDKHIRISPVLEILEIEGEGSKRCVRTKSVGNFYKEAVADIISIYGTENLKSTDCPYFAEMFQLKYLMNLQNISMSSVLDGGLIEIINSYDSDLINDLIEFMDNADTITTIKVEGKEYSGITVEDNIKMFSIAYGKHLKGEKDDMEIIRIIDEASMGILNENDFNDIINGINENDVMENNNIKDDWEMENEK